MISAIKTKTLLKFTNLLIKKGKKTKASLMVLKTLFLLKKTTKKNPINILNSTIKTLTPGVSTRKTVVAGRLYHLPCAITNNKALYFGCNWLQQSVIKLKEGKKNLSLSEKLSLECLKILKKKGNAILLLKQHNKIVSDNRPFLRFVRRKRRVRIPRKLFVRRRKMLYLKRRNFKYKKYPKLDDSFDFKLNNDFKYKKINLFDTKIETKFQNKLNNKFSRIDKKRDFISKIRIIKSEKEKNVSSNSKKKKYIKNKTINKKNKIQRR